MENRRLSLAGRRLDADDRRLAASSPREGSRRGDDDFTGAESVLGGGERWGQVRDLFHPVLPGMDGQSRGQTQPANHAGKLQWAARTVQSPQYFRRGLGVW